MADIKYLCTQLVTIMHAPIRIYIRSVERKWNETRTGCMTSERILQEILKDMLKSTGIYEENESSFPVIIRKGTNDFGNTVRFYLNYSTLKQSITYRFKEGRELLSSLEMKNGQKMELLPWGLNIIEECEV